MDILKKWKLLHLKTCHEMQFCNMQTAHTIAPSAGYSNPDYYGKMQRNKEAEIRSLIYRFILFLFIASFPIITLSAQYEKKIQAPYGIDSILNVRGEAYIAVSVSKYKSAPEFVRLFSLDKIVDDTAFIYITAKDTHQLNSGGISYSLLKPPSLRTKAAMAESIQDVLMGKAYPSYAQYLEIMGNFQTDYPEILKIDTIGYSINNKLILAARIITGNLQPETRPLVHLSSTMHGDEPPGYVVLLMLINELMKDYYVSDEITNLLNQITLIINPLSNPDGTYFMSDNTVSGSKRTNLNNVDLNRNFPDPYAGNFPNGTPRQPENQVMIDYLQKYPPSLSANLHTEAEVVNYPWDWRQNPNPSDNTPNPHPDDTWFFFVSKEYADTARSGHPNYMSSFPPWGITNGAAWYPVYGGRQDYVTAFLRGRELTLEISDIKIPPATQLLYYYERNKRSLINYIKHATYGIHGFVLDEATHEPLSARLNLNGYDDGYSYVISDSINGSFRRYLKAGSYSLTIEKQGYISKIIELNVSDYKRHELNILLRSQETTIPFQEIKSYPNPFFGEFSLDFYLETPGLARIELTGMNGQRVYEADYEAIEGNNTIIMSNIPAGVYVLKVITKESEMVKRIVGF